ncbi:ABC-2 type transporter [Thermodesulfobium acidiphilum]|uniref:Transport permease protein n=1 Tax=Thermodesulfobium acidiphilum TaxID=1794699 RepID=A0A2R4W1L4_THEAF|nr:ABC transporter permease [Thermodesulfobium acidiphilum]AWB10669.1 ABC-2 type transporter [Thermodesulfobium acidiphilum]PMP85269.1 MAG: hypothetical protein C0174_04955 [Thermodesulfobium narugense]
MQLFREVFPIVLRDLIVLKRRLIILIGSNLMGPILYLTAFGWGLGSQIHTSEGSYLNFVLPGILSLTAMTSAFNGSGPSITISRIYTKTFEELLIAPIKTSSIAIAKIITGLIRGILACISLIFVSFFYGANPFLWNAIFIIHLTFCLLIFSSMGVVAGLIASSHETMNRLNSFFITPMAFLGGTFFNTSLLPFPINQIISLLPITPCSNGLRAAALGKPQNLSFFFLESIWLIFLVSIIIYILKNKELTTPYS